MKELSKSNFEVPEIPVGLHYAPEIQQSVVHHFYITGEIGPAHYYIEMIHIIRTAPSTDVIYIHLNTTGGQLDTGIQIINAMNESNAHIICSIEAQAFSLGSMIFLSADDYIVHENSMLMIHNFNGALSGKGNEQRLRLDAITTLFDSFVRPLYIPFIDEEEFENVIDGKDIWLQCEQIKERLEKMLELRNIDQENKLKPKKRVSKKKS